ncbi:hypothetical protein BT67DRAFT_376242, partial [Trichocladium antarcticum]
LNMTVSLPHPRTVDPVLPPMPRRQSCDRCHEQKVRCVSDARDGLLSRGGMAKEGQATPGRHVVSSAPCARCRKAGAVCIYSRTFGMGDSKPPNQHSETQQVQEHVPPQIVSLSPAATTPRCDQTHQLAPDLATPPIPDQWLMSPFGSESSQFSTGMCQLSSFSQPTAAPTIPCVPLFEEPCPDMPSAAGDVVGDYAWAHPGVPDYSLEELAQINLRIHLAGRALATPARALVSMSSPAVDDIFGAACSLVNIVDRYAAKGAVPPPRLTDDEGGVLAQSSLVIDSALGASIHLMIHACHQALLGVFEDLSTSFLVQLTALQQPTPPGTPPGPAVFPPCSAQVGVMTNLMNHLAEQLDRAIGSLHSVRTPPQPVRFSPRHGSPECGLSEPFAGHYVLPHTHFDREKIQSRLFYEMEHRQLRVRDRMKSVGRLLRP